MLRFGLMALVYKGQNGLDLHRDTKALALIGLDLVYYVIA